MFTRFGQVYLTSCYPGIVKAWHAHRRQTDHICCVSGMLKLGLYDDREESPTRGETASLVIGPLSPRLVLIPPQVWHGFTAVGGETALVINVPTAHYEYEDPDELRRDPFDPEIPFEWLTRGG
jgi:dTDP-4-dehydrorhamnose 3,5-epimerase